LPNQLVTTNIVTGVVENWNTNGKSFTLKVTSQVQVPNSQGQADTLRAQAELQQAQAEVQKAEQELASAKNIKNPQQRQQKINDAEKRLTHANNLAADARKRAANAGQSSVKIETSTQNVPMQLADDVLVRTQTLPPFFDDKGNARKPTDDELKDLQQPAGFPGYKAMTSDLANGEVVTAYVGYSKGASPSKPSPGSAVSAGSGSGSGSASGSGSGSGPARASVTVVVILKGSAGSGSGK
jgi:hypothetical protein